MSLVGSRPNWVSPTPSGLDDSGLLPPRLWSEEGMAGPKLNSPLIAPDPFELVLLARVLFVMS